MSQEPKKKSSLKTKIIIALVGMVILLCCGVWLGLRLQSAYYNFIFNANQSLIKYSFYAVFILIAILAIYIFVMIRKFRKGKK